MQFTLHQLVRRVPLFLTMVSVALLLTGCPGGKGGGY
jgi:hypothetical protein